MANEKLPPITRGANSTIPDYEANVDVLFAAMVNVNERLVRAAEILEDSPKEAPEGTGDKRDFQTMALLLKEDGFLAFEQQLLQMRDDFYSGDPKRKKPWLDMLYDRYDNIDVGKLDPSKPGEARMLLESAALSQTFPVKLKENYEYKKDRYKTTQAQNVLEQRNEYGLPFESMAQTAIAKAYEEDGTKVPENDPRPDPFTAHELGISSNRLPYKMATAMTIFSVGQDSRFYYPGAQRVTAEYQMNKTGKVLPLRFTLPQEFSDFAGINIDELDPQEIMSGPLTRMATSYVDKMFTGRNALDEKSPYSERVFINGKSVAEVVNEKFPQLKPFERAEMIPTVIAMAMANGDDKISTVFAVKNDKGVYQACPIEVQSDLTAIYSSPEALEEAMVRQAQANSRTLTQKEQESYDRGLKVVNRGLFEFSTKSKQDDLEEEYMLDGGAAKELATTEKYERRENEQVVEDSLFIQNRIDRLDLPFYNENGVADPMEYQSQGNLIPEIYQKRSIDGLTLDNCGTRDDFDELSPNLSKFAIRDMDMLDVVLIDGKSVSAQVSERYPEVTDPSDQRRLGKAMLGIALSNGQHRLTTINPIKTTAPGVLQIQEKPVHLNVTTMYPTKEEEFSAFRLKYFDWGPFKCVTKGEIAQKKQEELMAKPLTDMEEEVKMVTLQKLNQKIIQKTCKSALYDYVSPETKKIAEEKLDATKKLSAEKDAIIKGKLEAWTKNALAPAQPNAQPNVGADIIRPNEIQAKPEAKAKPNPMGK